MYVPEGHKVPIEVPAGQYLGTSQAVVSVRGPVPHWVPGGHSMQELWPAKG